MDSQHHGEHHILHVGMRNIKTALAVSLCALVYFFFDRSPIYACIGAVFGMGSDLQESKRSSCNRLFGNIIGGLLSVALFRLYLVFYPQGGYSLLLVLLLFIGMVVLVMLCQLLWKGGVTSGSVVLCLILLETSADGYIIYALNRVFDTAAGILMALVVNSVFPGGITFHRIKRVWKRLDSNGSSEEASCEKIPKEE